MELFDGSFPCRELDGNSGDSLIKIAGNVNPDIIYIHKMSDVGILKPLLKKVRIVRMVHDHDICCPRRHKYFLLSGRVCRHKADWRCWLDGAFIGREDSRLLFININNKLREIRRNQKLELILVGSRFMQEELFQNGFQQSGVSILPPAVKQADQSFSKIPSAPEILFVGQLIKGKGVDLLLTALAKLEIPFNAVIVGDGNSRRELESLRDKLGLQESVQFKGWVNNSEIGKYYFAAKVVTVPSRWPEPFGMIGLEAMRYGRPVVAFNVGGIGDWLEHGETGLLVDEQDTGSFAKALKRIITDGEYASKLGRNAHKRVHEKYSFKNYIETLERFLQGDEKG
jgi:glycosyltransferase involved in cell wall biosynthesis